MIEEVAQQNHAIGTFGLDGGHEALAPVSGTVDVRRNDELHVRSFLRDGFLASMIRGKKNVGGGRVPPLPLPRFSAHEKTPIYLLILAFPQISGRV